MVIERQFLHIVFSSIKNPCKVFDHEAMDSKKGWEPPKILPAEETDSQVTSDQSQDAKSSFNFITDNQAIHKETDLPTHNAGEVSQFSTLLERNETQPEEKVSEEGPGKSQFSFISASAAAKTASTEKKRVEVTPRKKKKKAVQPGYGKTMETASSDIIQKTRSSSTTSASETRSEGSVESDVMKIDESKENYNDIENREETFIHRKESTSSYDSSAFTVLSDDDGVRGYKKAEDITRDDGSNVAGARDDLAGDGEASKMVDAVERKELVGNEQIDNMNQPTESNVLEINEESMPDVDSSLHEVPNVAYEDTKPDVVDRTTATGNEETLCNGKLNKKTIEIETHLDQGQFSCSEVAKEIMKIGDAIEKTLLNKEEICVRVERLKELGDVFDKSYSSYQLTLDEEEKTELYLQTLESREQLLREQLNSLRKSHIGLLCDLKETTFSKDYLVSQIAQLQDQQQLAIKQDDFSSAESINHQLEEKQNDLNNFKYRHPIVERRVSELFEQSNLTIKTNLQECDTLEREFEEIISTERKSLNEKITKNDNSLYKAKLLLSEEKTKLDREMGHIALDKEHLCKGKVKLDKEIMDRTKEKQEEKVRLTQDRDVIRNEIRELELRLDVLRKKEDLFNLDIDKVNLAIQEMTKDFLPQMERLEKEEKEIIAKEVENNSKLEMLEKESNDLKERQEKEENFERRCKDNIETLSTKIASLKQLKLELEENVIHLKDVIDLDLICFSPSEEHQSMIDKLSKLSEELSTAKYKDIDCGAQIARMKKRLDDIEARVEELEKKKQIAASARNFKAAKSIIEERDNVSKEGQELQEQLRLIESDKKTLNLSIEELNNKISQTNESISSTEADLDKNISSSLVKAISKLQEYLTRYANHNENREIESHILVRSAYFATKKHHPCKTGL
eukprot:gene13691-4598_t